MDIYDDQQAVAFIRSHVGSEIADLYDDDEFFNVIDIIMDWYDDNDLLDPASESELDENVDKLADSLTDHVADMVRRDSGSRLKPEHVRAVVEAELAYEDSLIDF